jgi:hypothetical protein
VGTPRSNVALIEGKRATEGDMFRNSVQERARGGIEGALSSGRKQDLLKNEEEPERDTSEQNVQEGERGR